MIDIRLITYFIEVARNLNFTKAADKLFISQPSLSRQIMGIEDELGVKLFSRSKHEVKLTKAGEVFLKGGIEILEKYHQVIDDTRAVGKGLLGSLSVGYIGVSNDILLSIMDNFRQRFDDVDIHLSAVPLGANIDALLTGKIDIAFTNQFEGKKSPLLNFVPYDDMEFCLAVSNDHPLAQRDSVAICELKDEKFVFYDDEFGYNSFMEMFEERGIHPHMSYIVKKPLMFESLLMQVGLGVGITLVPKTPEILERPFISFVDIEDGNIKMEMGLAWKKDSDNPIISMMEDMMKELTLV